MRTSIVAVWLLCVLGAARAAGGSEPSAGTPAVAYIPVSAEAFEGAIVPKERASSFSIPGAAWRDRVEYWTPGADDVLRLERGVKKYLKRVARKETPWDSLRDYRRQYVGYVIDGRKRVYCNFFCDPQAHDWRNAPVQVSDGGPCYFHVDYDMESGRFLSWTVNGP